MLVVASAGDVTYDRTNFLNIDHWWTGSR